MQVKKYFGSIEIKKRHSLDQIIRQHSDHFNNTCMHVVSYTILVFL